MATSTSPLKISRPSLRQARTDLNHGENQQANSRRRLFKLYSDDGNDNFSIRIYTEEQVAELLQVSLSKLRKWRMKGNRTDKNGPPFKKIGRLVRYPEAGLYEYINK